jgi:hypothetical protein
MRLAVGALAVLQGSFFCVQLTLFTESVALASFGEQLSECLVGRLTALLTAGALVQLVLPLFDAGLALG